jgi:hypothetical protein
VLGRKVLSVVVGLPYHIQPGDQITVIEGISWRTEDIASLPAVSSFPPDGSRDSVEHANSGYFYCNQKVVS